jgi:sn-glycerol 3-phosphate transport system substrate-binding protein
MASDRSSSRSRRRAPRALVAAAALGLVAAACGAPPSSGNENGGRDGAEGKKLPECPVKAIEDAKGTTNVNLWYGGLGGSPGKTLENMTKSFNASNGLGIKVTANNQGSAYEETLRKYEQTAPTPKQLPQIIYLEDTALGEMVDRGQVIPAQSCMEADGYDMRQISQAALDAFSVDGVLYPGYLNVSTPVLYYNQVAFQKAGLDPKNPPRTLEEVRKAAEVLKAKGVAETPLSFKNDRWFFETWLAGMGQTVVNNDNGRKAAPTKATFNTPEALKLLQFFQQMKKDGLVLPFARTEGSIDQYLAVVQGKAAMLVETSTASSTIRDALGGKITAEDAGINFDSSLVDTATLVPGSAQLPGVDNTGQIYASGGAFYILNTGTKAQQAAAWKFLRFMLEPKNAYEWHTNGGYLPVVKKALTDPRITSFWQHDVAGQMLKNAVDQLYSPTLAAKPGPVVGPYQDYAKTIDTMLNNVMLDGADPAKELAKAEADATKVLQDYNGG